MTLTHAFISSGLTLYYNVPYYGITEELIYGVDNISHVFCEATLVAYSSAYSIHVSVIGLPVAK